MSDFISARTLIEATLFASTIFLVFHALRAARRSVTFGIELIVQCAQKAKSGGYTLKALGSALLQLVTQGFDVGAPLVVLAAGIGVLVLEFQMLSFVPNLTFLEVIVPEAITVAIIWRSLEAYVQHVQRKRDALTEKPKKKG